MPLGGEGRRAPAVFASLSETKSIDVSVGTDIETIRSRDQSLEVSQAAQRLAHKNRFARIAAERVSRSSLSAPSIHTMGLEWPSVVVTIGEPRPRSAPHQAVVIRGGEPVVIFNTVKSCPWPG